jgi:hypothetical protein
MTHHLTFCLIKGTTLESLENSSRQGRKPARPLGPTMQNPNRNGPQICRLAGGQSYFKDTSGPIDGPRVKMHLNLMLLTSPTLTAAAAALLYLAV